MDWRRSTDPTRQGGIDFLRVDLLEVSQVPVPALPNALVTARAAGIDLNPLAEWCGRALDLQKEPIGMTRSALAELRRAAGAPQLHSLKTVEERTARAKTIAAELGIATRFRSFDEQLRAIFAAQHPESTNPFDARLQRAPSGSSEGAPEYGGFLIQDDFAETIWNSVYERQSNLARFVTLQPVSGRGVKIPAIDESSRVDGSRWGGVTGFWQNEADSVTGTKPKGRLVNLDKKKVIVATFATNELAQDSAAFSAWLQRVMTAELAFQLDKAIYLGTGLGQPNGIIGAAATIVVAKDVGQPNGTVSATNVIGMWSRMAGPSRRNAIWVGNEDVEGQLDAAAATSPAPGLGAMYFPRGANGNEFPLVKGKPFFTIEQAPALGQTGDLSLLDLSQYLLIEPDFATAFSIDLKFLTDEIVIRLVMRTDGAPTWSSALTPYNGSSTRSPFIVLAAR